VEAPPGFRFWVVTIEAGVDRIYKGAEWQDALVVVARGGLELQSLQGDSYRFAPGCILCLHALPLRALRSYGPEPTVLVAVSRADEFSFGRRSKEEILWEGRKPR
jgi:hypothetical protein